MTSAWNAVIVGENWGEQATLSGGSYNASFPITNVQTRFQRTVARTTDATNASTKIVADLGSSQPVGAVVVCNGNWSLDSRYRVESSDDSGFSVLKYDSGWKQYPGFVVDPSLLDSSDPDHADGVLRNNLLGEFPLNLIEILPAASVARTRYWRVLFDDTANTNGYLQYGYLIIGRAMQVGINYGGENSFSAVPTADMMESLGGERTWFEHNLRRTWRGTFEFLTDAERFGTLTRIAVKSRTSRPTFFVPDPSDTLYLQARSFLGTFAQAPAVVQSLVPNYGQVAMEFNELI
jgi:hypothetical protein